MIITEVHYVIVHWKYFKFEVMNILLKPEWNWGEKHPV